MRNLLIPLVLLASTGCGLFGSPESTLESYYTDCIETYEAAEDEVGDADDIEEFFLEIQEWKTSWHVKTATARAELDVELEEMDPKDREDRIKEIADTLNDIAEDCVDAREDLREEIVDDEDLLDDYQDFQEELEEDWEDCKEAAKDEEYGYWFCGAI
jgi:hypothetical protein